MIVPSAKIYDVAIVGTGVSGALVADAVLQAGLTVVALDRRRILSGSTPASTALLQGELDTPLIELEKKLGKSDAARVWWRSAQCVRALTDRIHDLGIACQYEVYLPGNGLDMRGLQHEAGARQKIGLRSTLFDRKELKSFAGINKAGAIVSAGNAEADPVKLVAGLWKSNLSRGASLLQQTEVIGVDHTASHIQLETRNGRFIVGGEDEPFSDETKRDALLQTKVAAISRKAGKLFPELDFDPAFSWAGSFGESPNGLPAIGPVKGMPRCFAVLGFGGNGITFSMLAAQLVSRQIQCIADLDAALFAL